MSWWLMRAKPRPATSQLTSRPHAPALREQTMIGPMSEDPVETQPVVVLDLAEACVRFVKRALQIALDYTPDTLPLLDHYLRSASDISKEEILSLHVPAAGAYFGEVVRR